MRPSILPVLAALALLSGACAPVAPGGAPRSEVVLSVPERSYAPGDTVSLVLENRSGDAIGYNLCSSALERRSGGSWEAVPSDRVCTMELRSLPAGERTRYPLVLQAGLPGGEYRFRSSVEAPLGGGRLEVASGTFQVSQPGG